ncbi:MAG: hypothetical protein GKR98_17135 [Boseongicola sp.]|nr:MAG: hypothetical protein GKR98_17135 [Boseongicola sp.]
MKRLMMGSTAAIMLAAPATANEIADAMEDFYNSEVAGWSTNQLLVDAIVAQNAETAGYVQSDIDAMDQTWRAEVGQAVTPTISPVLENPASEFLRQQVEAYGGQITEVFIMDARGLNVAASDVTSDFWQGDEAKHAETFVLGPGSVHMSEIELDESTQRYQGQISFTMVDPSSGQAVGAITVGVDADALM